MTTAETTDWPAIASVEELEALLGRARLVTDAPFVVEIMDVFFHCAKAFLRSGLWKPESWDPDGLVPRRSVIASTVEPNGMSVEQLDDYYGPSYEKGLYG